jgi:hypothetical protein
VRSYGWLSTTSPTIFLAVLFAIGNVGWAIAAAYWMPVPSAFLVLYAVGVQWALAWWVLADCRHRGIPTSIDHGWVVFFAWPVAFPYHLIKTRGARGCLVMAGFLGLFAGSYVLALTVFLLLVR